MANPIRITLAGSLGSGKSSVGRALSKELGIEFVSTGEIFRSIGKVKNLSALQTNLEAETNQSIDDHVDGFIVEKSASDDPFIMDSRMAWHFVPQSLRVYIFARYDTAAARIQSDHTRDTEKYESVSEAEDALRKRRESEQRRYTRLYSVEIDDFENYDLVIVSDGASVDDIVSIILNAVKQQGVEKYWLPKTRLVPMIDANTPASPHPTSNDCLPAVFDDGFGFVFERTDLLLQVLNSNTQMVCIIPSQSPKTDMLAQSAALGTAHFTAWEERGTVELQIKKYMLE